MSSQAPPASTRRNYLNFLDTEVRGLVSSNNSLITTQAPLDPEERDYANVKALHMSLSALREEDIILRKEEQSFSSITKGHQEEFEKKKGRLQEISDLPQAELIDERLVVQELVDERRDGLVNLLDWPEELKRADGLLLIKNLLKNHYAGGDVSAKRGGFTPQAPELMQLFADSGSLPVHEYDDACVETVLLRLFRSETKLNTQLTEYEERLSEAKATIDQNHQDSTRLATEYSAKVQDLSSRTAEELLKIGPLETQVKSLEQEREDLKRKIDEVALEKEELLAQLEEAKLVADAAASTDVQKQSIIDELRVKLEAANYTIQCRDDEILEIQRLSTEHVSVSMSNLRQDLNDEKQKNDEDHHQQMQAKIKECDDLEDNLEEMAAKGQRLALDIVNVAAFNRSIPPASLSLLLRDSSPAYGLENLAPASTERHHVLKLADHYIGIALPQVTTTTTIELLDLVFGEERDVILKSNKIGELAWVEQEVFDSLVNLTQPARDDKKSLAILLYKYLAMTMRMRDGLSFCMTCSLLANLCIMFPLREMDDILTDALHGKELLSLGRLAKTCLARLSMSTPAFSIAQIGSGEEVRISADMSVPELARTLFPEPCSEDRSEWSFRVWSMTRHECYLFWDGSEEVMFVKDDDGWSCSVSHFEIHHLTNDDCRATWMATGMVFDWGLNTPFSWGLRDTSPFASYMKARYGSKVIEERKRLNAINAAERKRVIASWST